MVRYAIMFSDLGIKYCLVEYEWRLGRLRDGGWSAPRYKFAEWLSIKGNKIKLYETKEEAAQIARNLFVWDSGFDCGTIRYFTHKEDNYSIKVYPEKIRIVELTYDIPDLKFV